MTARKLRPVQLDELSADEIDRILRRSAVPDPEVRSGAAAICDDVRRRGDAAVSEAADRFGGGFFRVSPEEMETAAASLPAELREALDSAVANVQRFHRAQLPTTLTVTTVPGVEITRRWAPLRRVGAYVPGGKAAYPSTVIMTAVPAKIAGVKEVVVASPAAPDGSIDVTLLAACWLTGVDELWAMGGAQAIAALAYGTETLDPVDKIVGPGNAWVTAAKLAVFGATAIDLPAGPSEVLVLTDETSDPRLVAVDLLCQAEHGPDSPAILVTTDPTLPEKVEAEIDRLLPGLERSDILGKALADHGLSVIASDRDDAIAFTNRFASEHVTILTADAEADADRIEAAGSVYIGRWAPESAGDYATGANHVLPTGGLAMACGPLAVDDFGSWRQEQRLTREGLATITPTITRMATAEGLTAHRLAAEIRFDQPETGDSK